MLFPLFVGITFCDVDGSPTSVLPLQAKESQILHLIVLYSYLFFLGQ
jgi:hypothetical protein